MTENGELIAVTCLDSK